MIVPHPALRHRSEAPEGPAAPSPALPASAFAPAPARLARDVTALAREIETGFSAAGNRLMQVSDLLLRVQSPLRELLALSDGAELAQIHHQTVEHGGQIEALAADLGAALAGIGGIRDLGLRVNDAVAQTLRIVRTMTIVVLNARVTVASISTDRESLQSFTDAAGQLVNEAADLLHQVDQAITRIAKRNAEALTRAGTLKELIDRDLAAALAAMQGDLELFERGVRGWSDRSGQISAATEAMLGATTRAVAGMQIGDTTRQRLEHVAVILETPVAAPDAAPLARLGRVQLDDTAEAHAEGVAQFLDNTREVEAGLSRLVHDHLSQFENRRDAAALQGNLARLHGFVATAVGEQTHLLRHARSLETEFEQLGRLIEMGDEFESRMRLIAINAVIACANLGEEGRSLKEISTQLQGLATEAAGSFPKLKQHLTGMSGIALDTARRFDAVSAQARALETGAAVAIDTGVRRIDAILASVRSAAQEIRNSTGGQDRHLAAIERHGAKLTTAGGGWAATAATHPAEALTTEAGLALAGHAMAIYTMERERDLHRRIIVTAAAAAPAAAAAAPLVEFWGEAEAAAPAPAPAADAPAGAPSGDAMDDIFF